jgi:hypothetical protein
MKTSKKILSIISFPVSHHDLLSYIHIILECDFFKSIPYISIPMVRELMSLSKFTKDELLELTRNIKEDNHEMWVSILYQYSLYSYQLIFEQLKLEYKPDEITDHQIQKLADRIRLESMTKPDMKSDYFVFGNGLLDCMMESFIEFIVMFTDIQGDNFLLKLESGPEFITRAIKSLYNYTEIKKYDGADAGAGKITGINDITAELLYMMFNQNDIPFELKDCKNIILPELVCLIQLVHFDIPEQKNRIYRFINQFTNRGHILPIEKNTFVPPSEDMYPFDLLLAEQNRLRQSRSADLPENLKLIQDQLEEELSIIEDEKKRFIIMNRVNYIEIIGQKTKRTLPILPVPNKSIVESLLTPKELELPLQKVMERIYDLYLKRTELALSTEMITTLKATLLNGLITKTHDIAKTYKAIDGVFKEDIISELLQMMYKYDTEHMFLLYSMLCKFFEDPETQMVIANPKQASFLKDICDHLNWLHNIKLIPALSFLANIRNIFNRFFEEGTNKPLFHVNNDIDEYSPLSTTQWIYTQVIKRQEEFKLVMKQIPTDWKQYVNVSEFLSLLKKYDIMMNTDISNLSKQEEEITLHTIEIDYDRTVASFIHSAHLMINKLNKIIVHKIPESLDLFIKEMMRDLYKMKWFVKQADRILMPNPYMIKNIYWTMSYLLYGNLNHMLTDTLSGIYMEDKEDKLKKKASVNILQFGIERITKRKDYYLSPDLFIRVDSIVNSLLEQCKTISELV